ncbi:MAG: hypothetical protein Q7S45_02100 [Candidatus Curtissbacteria bacterium]|nr:hypothetical protein [Candidatus Curtissbacteria bacterium]
MKNTKLKTVISSNLTKSILISLGATALIGTILIFPGLVYIIREFEKNQYKTKYVKRALRTLEKQELISVKELADGSVEITITDKGKRKVSSYQIEDMKVTKPAKWDKKWRVIVFDIPEAKKASREAFRRKLQNLDFHRLQKSVFVYPYPCKKEVDFLKHYFDVANNITYIVATDIDTKNRLLDKFGL